MVIPPGTTTLYQGSVAPIITPLQFPTHLSLSSHLAGPKVFSGKGFLKGELNERRLSRSSRSVRPSQIIIFNAINAESPRQRERAVPRDDDLAFNSPAHHSSDQSISIWRPGPVLTSRYAWEELHVCHGSRQRFFERAQSRLACTIKTSGGGRGGSARTPVLSCDWHSMPIIILIQLRYARDAEGCY